MAAGGGHFLLCGRDRQRQDRGLPPRLRGRSRARPRRHRARPRDRAHAADARPLPRALRRPRGGAPLGAHRGGASRRARADRGRRGADRRRRALRGVRAGAAASASSAWTRSTTPSYKQESDPRYDARTVAAKRAALEGAVAVYGSATPRPESWARLERLELGGRLGDGPARRARRRHAPRGRRTRCPANSSPRWRASPSAAAARSSSSTAAASRRPSTADRAARRSAARTATSRSCFIGTTCSAATTAAVPRPRPSVAVRADRPS